MSFFKLSTGENVQSNGNYEGEGQGFALIPNNTKLVAMITECKWAENEYIGRHIKARYDVVEGEYKKRVLFRNFKVCDPDAEKRDKAMRELAAVDANCGGKIAALDHEPTDMELTRYLSNSPMLINVIEIKPKDGGDPFNWISTFESRGGKKSAPQQQAQQKPAEPDTSASGGSDLDGEIPFAPMHYMMGG